MPGEPSRPKRPRAVATISSSSTRPTGCSTPSSRHSPRTSLPSSPRTASSWSRRTSARSPSCHSRSGRAARTAQRGLRSSNEHRRSAHGDLPRELRPGHARPPGHHPSGGRDLRPRRRRSRPRAEPQADDVLGRRAGRLPRGSTPRPGQRRGRRLLRARRRVREAVGREDDGQRPARDLRLRVGVPDEPPEPHARPGRGDRVPDVEPAVQLRLLERRQRGRVVRRQRRRARARGSRAPLQGDVPRRQARSPGVAAGMSRRARTLIIVGACVVLAFVAAALGYALTRDDGPHKPRYPGRIAVREGCGLRHTFFDGSDPKTMCLPGVFDTVSVSRNGKKLAWDTTGGMAIMLSEVDGSSPVNIPVPLGSNTAPSLAPDGKKIAFLHSARDDGNYDVWVTSTTTADAEQLTNTRNVSDVVWSPTGEWLAYVQNWSEDTLEGQISLVRPNGDDPHTVVDGDAPDWSPDGKKLVYVHNGSIWTVDADGSNADRIIPNAHSPAWSRDGQMIAFMRTEKCGRNLCPEHAYFAFANGTQPTRVGPAYATDRQIVWLPDPFE